ncbi:AMP-binding protein [Changpingibacter yushuensis]|uniref:AMP-binding protein n=1 Tax=Changpingibacter yushuensis TaxID=2758440 RepID=UPI0015F64951|nr:AMP-binding protein [Changpingibacter yushuensis]
MTVHDDERRGSDSGGRSERRASGAGGGVGARRLRILRDASVTEVAQATRDLLKGGAPIFLHAGAGGEGIAQEIEDLGLLPAEAALLLRTSGTTSGTGKVVVCTLNSLLASAGATEQALGGPGRWVTCLSPAHIAGFHTVFRSVVAGFEPIEAGHGSPEDLAHAALCADDGERLYLSLVPTQLFRLLSSPHVPAARRFDGILVGGAATPPELLERARSAGLAVFTTYGMTETCGGCVYNGKPIGNTDVSLSPSGNISIAGDVVSWGYLGDQPFEGRFTTEDIGRIEDGRLVVLGRADDAITTGGMTVMPSIIEAEIMRLGYGQCVVVGIPDPEWGEAVVAICDARLATRESEIRASLSAKLDRSYVPRKFVPLPALGFSEFPQRVTGKIDRALLRRHLIRFGTTSQET